MPGENQITGNPDANINIFWKKDSQHLILFAEKNFPSKKNPRFIKKGKEKAPSLPSFLPSFPFTFDEKKIKKILGRSKPKKKKTKNCTNRPQT